MRSKAFIGMYLLALAAGSLVAILLCWSNWSNEFGNEAGKALFYGDHDSVDDYILVLGAHFHGPIHVKEAAEDSWYLLELTGMKPIRCSWVMCNPPLSAACGWARHFYLSWVCLTSCAGGN